MGLNNRRCDLKSNGYFQKFAIVLHMKIQNTTTRCLGISQSTTRCLGTSQGARAPHKVRLGAWAPSRENNVCVATIPMNVLKITRNPQNAIGKQFKGSVIISHEFLLSQNTRMTQNGISNRNSLGVL